MSCVTDDVKEYYGKVLQATSDLKTNACCTMKGQLPPRLRAALALVHPKVIERYYGCGLIMPECLDGAKVLDLGSGSGQDCYVLSQLVGQNGHVTGIDMTEEQLAVAREYESYHAEKFGYASPNTTFVQGYIERLDEAGLAFDTFDVIVSNCVVNLSPDKEAVLREAYRVLKTGGELYFSDVYSDIDMPEEARNNEVLWGECISGALKWQDLHRIVAEIGFSEPRIQAASRITVDNEQLQGIVGPVKFVSVTYRLFKLPAERESPSSVIYGGQLTDSGEQFQFDHRTSFTRGQPVVVNAELATILKSSRFAAVFSFTNPQLSDPRVDPFDLLPGQKSTAASTVSSKCCSGGSCAPKEAAQCAVPVAKCCGGNKKCG